MLSLEEFKVKYAYDKATPMMMQYLDLKFQHQDALLLFRMGDFYELFLEDAITASQILGIALAKRNAEAAAMCGVPHHALENYLFKLIEAGHKVAICEQLESPEEAKKRGYKAIVKRDIVRVITKGTITEESILDTSKPNYLFALHYDKASDNACISYIDLGTLEFFTISLTIENLAHELARLDPQEIILAEYCRDNRQLYELLQPYREKLVYMPNSTFALNKSKRIIEDFYYIKSTEAIGDLTDSQIIISGVILEYIRITQKKNVPDFPYPKIISDQENLIIDPSTRRNLELVRNLSGENKNTLFAILNKCQTKQGSRLLNTYITSPLASKNKIDTRLNVTNFFCDKLDLTNHIRNILKNFGDIDRFISRIAMHKSSPKDLLDIKEAIISAKELRAAIGHENPEFIEKILTSFDLNDDLLQLIVESIDDDARSIQSSGYIRSSYNQTLAQKRELIDNNQNLMLQLQQKYISITGLDNLKLNKNNVLGMFIEVTPKNADKINSEEFIHKQSLATAVRYTTNELQKIEYEISNAQNIINNLESEIFFSICQEVIKYKNNLRKLAYSISTLDVFTNFALLAREFNYIKPNISNNNEFEIIGGRHPVVEQVASNFVENDCNLAAHQNLWLLTGPNMAGKSTFLRQNALILIMAQMGSYVPATNAKIGVADKLFSRIGAADDLSKGQSTFMMEMIETSAILAQATDKSLVILDEIGRGTSTHDGVAIAMSTLEYIHNNINCRGLFATHYHELAELSDNLNHLKKYTIAIDDKADKLVFLYKMIEGVADHSYGIHAAEMAGMPSEVINRAKDLLSTFNK